MNVAQTNRKIAFTIPFNNSNVLNQYQLASTKDWISYRLHIFIHYTLSSLLKQTNQDFIAAILCNPNTMDFIRSELKKYTPLPKHIFFTTTSEYYNILSDYLNGIPYFFEISLHSDDLYHHDFVQYISSYTPLPNTQVLICQNGYLYDSVNGRLFPYFNFSRSFNCFIYLANEFLKGYRYSLRSYMGAIHLKHEFLRKPWYINHAHNRNTSFYVTQEINREYCDAIWDAHPNKCVLINKEITSTIEIQNILHQYM